MMASMPISSSVPFAGPRLKIERAKRHISELDTAIARFNKRHPYRIVVEQDADPAYHLFILRIKENIPDTFALILGDAVHNLRSALDLLTCDLISIHAGEAAIGERETFPFSKGNDVDLKSVFKKGLINKISPEALDFIGSLKTYKRGNGNPALWGLHDLDIHDKHKLLIPVAKVVKIENMTVTQGQHVRMLLKNIGFGGAEDGAKLLKLPAANNVKVGQYFRPTIDVTFGNIEPFKGQSLIPTLHQLTDLVSGIVEALAALCFGRRES